jgi:thymidylate kinase
MSRRDWPRDGPPAVVAIEGLCFAGKTTLAVALAADPGVVALAEYAELGPLPAFPPADRAAVAAALEHFLRLDHYRAAVAGASHARVVLCDRSPLTLIAYEHAMSVLGVPRDPDLAARLFTTAAERGDILAPDGYIHLRISHRLVLSRQRQRGAVRTHLTDHSVCARMDEICQRYLARVPPQRRLLLDSREPLTQTAGLARSFLHHLPATTAGPPPPWTCLAALPGRAPAGSGQ